MKRGGRMHREIGLIGLTFVAVSGIIGSGWLFAPLLASQHAGPAALIAWAIGGAAMLFIALTFAEISAMLPVAGGIARVPQFSHGNVVAMAMGWSAWIGYNTTAPIEVEAMLRYLAPYAPWLHDGSGRGALTGLGMLIAAGLLAAFTVINAFGVRFFTYVNSTLTWVKIAIPLVVIGALIASRFEAANFTAVGGFSPFGVHGVLAAVSAGGVMFSYIGFRHIIDMAGEARHPGFTIPAALILSVVICFVVYGGMQIAFIGSLSGDMLSNGWNGLFLSGQLGPLEAVATALGLLWLVSVLNVGAVISPFGGGLVATGSNARLAYALAENGFFPRIFARLSARGVPLPALLLNLGVAAVVFVAMPFDEIVQLNSSAIILSFVVGPVAVVALRHLLPDRARPVRLPAVAFIAAPAFIIATLVIYWSGWDTLWRLGLALLAGLVLFLIHMRTREPGALDLREATWLVPYLAGLGALSFLGTFGGRGILPFGWDIAAIALFSLAVFAHAVRCRLPQDRFDRYMRDSETGQATASSPSE